MAARKPSPELRAFGAEVTRLRELAELTRTDLAPLVSVSRSYAGQVEAGTTRCRRDYAERLDKALGSGATLAETWDDLLRSTGYPRWFADYPKAESSAALLRAYHETFVYGLFQTEAYARELLVTDEALEARMRRQTILTRKDPPTISVVIGETVLLRNVGGRNVMREQLERLEEISRYDNVSLQIAPIAYYRGVAGSFDIATQAGGDELLFLETTPGGITSNEPPDILYVIGAFSALQARSMTTDDSRKHIREVWAERWT